MPGIAALAGLVLCGFLGVRPALVAAAAVLGLAVAVAGPFAVLLVAVRAAVETQGADALAALTPAARRARRLNPPANALFHTLHRLTRAWSARVARAEMQLGAAEAVVAAVPDPLILVDGKRQIVHANAHAAEFLGSAALPHDLAQSLRHPAVLAAADEVLAGAPSRVVEFALSMPQERRLRARLARIDRPALDGAVAILTLYDITQLKRAEQMRADFIANASHELKTPLATLAGFIETLQGPARGDAKARDRFLAIMESEARRMSRLVDDLLSLSRIELNEHIVPQGRVALGPLLGDVAAALELRAASRGMTIRLAVPPELVAVRGDRDELAQVFHNLIDNAIKYGRQNSTVGVAAAPALRARPGDPAPAAFVRVAISDEGDGIPAAHLPRLTERFYRVDTARSREMGGTGLGLAIVKHILNHHRGLLEIDSVPAKGSVFAVFVPATPGDGGAPAPGTVITVQ
jgi:two-component system phosphate regulon sensor histidine kinase PhoR